MKPGRISNPNNKTSKRHHARSRWQNKNDIPRVGGRRANNAYSTAAFNRRMEKWDTMQASGGAFARIAARIAAWLSPQRNYKPVEPDKAFKGEIL